MAELRQPSLVIDLGDRALSPPAHISSTHMNTVLLVVARKTACPCQSNRYARPQDVRVAVSVEISVVSPSRLDLIGAEALRACGVGKWRCAAALELQQPGPRNHGTVVDAVPVVGGVERGAALLAHLLHHLL